MTSLAVLFFAMSSGQNTLQNKALDLRWKPVSGAVTEYDMVITSQDKSQPFAAEAVIVQTVSKVSSEGYTVRSVNKGTMMRMGTEEIRDERTNESVVRHAGNGAVLSIEKAQNAAETRRLAVVTRFVAPPAPVNIGGGWQHRYEPDREFPGARISYRFRGLVELNKFAVAEIEFTFGEDGRERPYKGSGTWWVDANTGQPLRMKATVENWMSGGTASGTISLTKR